MPLSVKKAFLVFKFVVMFTLISKEKSNHHVHDRHKFKWYQGKSSQEKNVHRKNSPKEKISPEKIPHSNFFPFSVCDFLSCSFFILVAGEGVRVEDQHKFHSNPFILWFVKINYHSWVLNV